MINSFKNIALLIIIALVTACNMTDFLEAIDHAKITCDGKYKDNISQLKACKNGVEHLQYTAIRSQGPVKEAKLLCEVSYASNQDSYSACLKGIHFLFIERKRISEYYSKSIGEQDETSALAIANYYLNKNNNPFQIMSTTPIFEDGSDAVSI